MRRCSTCCVAACLVASAMAMVWAGCDTDSGVHPEAEAESETVRISLGGDVMFGRWIGGQLREYQTPEQFEQIGRHMQNADLAVVNLETGLCDVEVAHEGRHAALAQLQRFTAPPERAAWLAERGVDAAVVANNHAMDCGADGLDHTLMALEQEEIVAAGTIHRDTGEPKEALLHLEADGHQGEIGIIAATAHIPPVTSEGDYEPAVVDHDDKSDLVSQVQSMRGDHPNRTIVVSLHWGQELAPEHDDYQRSAAEQLADAGADIIYGHGPHVVHDAEMIDETAVLYSAGNLHFDMNRPDAREIGIADVQLEFDDRWRPVGIDWPFEGERIPPDDRMPAQQVRHEPSADVSTTDDSPDERFQPNWSESAQPTLKAYFDDERTQGFFTVEEDDRRWTSEIYPMWKAAVADVSGDGDDEVIAGVWSNQLRHDDPSPHKTLWVLGWDGRRLFPKWRGSAMARPMSDFSIHEAASDRLDELVVDEQLGDNCFETTYRWTGFGFAERQRQGVDCETLSSSSAEPPSPADR